MKKIILTIVLSPLLPAIAVAGDHVMRNDNPNASHPSKGNAGAANTNGQETRRYSIVPYQK